MTVAISDLLNNKPLTKEQLVQLLAINNPDEHEALLQHGLNTKAASVGRIVYLRGLIELTNKCAKNCYYCGIRAGNTLVDRYFLSDEAVLQAAEFAHKNHFGSLVIQTGELSGPIFAAQIERLLKLIHRNTNNELTITLSCGEQSPEVYQQWKEAGASRYLLRIEASNRRLYESIHPSDGKHDYDARIKGLEDLKKCGYQVGTGVMIGLPGQTLEDLADDLLFFTKMDIDMVGMGPYLEHADTPMFDQRNLLLPAGERFLLSLRMIALLRIMMPYINIAASTALETINPLGRQMGILAGANVVMPNLTPVTDRKKYLLYNNKPNLEKDASVSTSSLNEVLSSIGEQIGYGLAGNSIHFTQKHG
jgi:biotin synthase